MNRGTGLPHVGGRGGGCRCLGNVCGGLFVKHVVVVVWGVFLFGMYVFLSYDYHYCRHCYCD